MPVFDYSPAIAADPEIFRIHAREEAYPNQTAEKAEVKRVDDAVFDRVRMLENALVKSSESLIERGKELTEGSADVEQQLREQVKYQLDYSSVDLKLAAEQYSKLQSQAQQRIDALERLAREAEWLADRAEDPYMAYRKLVIAYPALSKKY
ncbi:hypothetical protein [Curtobacterium sp. VKM Ac-2884]|uniref:hypothetical protein n=1 Tax=Curtobacterium sp. VKM Ac-2884 TaxID=2783818 RepID=UPI00188D0140|nr:hypothetical protein [Curtobacterium sp. VKM Ac-2884]MBF4604713.1 hypothetical protein [Curtobacterium sp. VKM Ac-2884]